LRKNYGDIEITGNQIKTPDGNTFAVRVVDWPLDREKAANVAANNPHVAGEFTEDVAALLAEIQAADEKLFAALALDKLGADYPLPPEEGLTDADEVPEVQAEVVSQTGDLWLLGEHRVLCGDSTNAGDVALLMAGEKADICFTDPPYGVSYADKNKYLNAIARGNRIQVPIENDHMTEEQTGALVRGL
jgi:hypothetical protein